MMKNLERIGVVSKKIMETSLLSVKYLLTSNVRELRKYLIPMRVWVLECGGHDMPGCQIKAGKHIRL